MKYRVGDLAIDTGRQSVTLAGTPISLPKLSYDLLLVLTRAAPNVVTVDQLMREIWPGLVVSPETVSKRVTLLREALGEDSQAPRYIATLRGRGYQMVAEVATEIESAVQSGPPTLQLTNPPSLQVTGRSVRNRTSFIVAAILIVCVATLEWQYRVRHAWSEAATDSSQPASARSIAVLPLPDKSIAVLPFVDMSEKKDQEYFAEGLAEEILDLLANIPGIRVIGRTSSFQFKNKTEDLREIGKALEVAYILEGSVRKSGERMRVTAQLIDTHDGSQVWTGSYDEGWEDVLKVQDKITSGLARALQVTLGADHVHLDPMPVNLAAYDLYLRGRHAYDRFDKEGFETAAAYFQQAVNLDPSSIRTAEWLAMVNESTAEWAFVPPRDGYERTRASVQRAIALNPRSGIGHSILSVVNTIYDWDWSSAAAEAKLALELEPHSALVLANASTLSAALGQLDETERLTTEALALDPLNAGWHQVLGYVYYRTGRLTEAEAEMRKTVQISPTYVTGHYSLGLVLLDEGKLAQALAEILAQSRSS